MGMMFIEYHKCQRVFDLNWFVESSCPNKAVGSLIEIGLIWMYQLEYLSLSHKPESYYPRSSYIEASAYNPNLKNLYFLFKLPICKSKMPQNMLQLKYCTNIKNTKSMKNNWDVYGSIVMCIQCLLQIFFHPTLLPHSFEIQFFFSGLKEVLIVVNC